MNFGFTETQREIQRLAKTILADQVTAESLAAYDEYQTDRFDKTLWQDFANAGLLGLAVDETYGGMGLGFTELALLIEEIGRTIAPLPLIPHLVSAALPLQQFGSAALKERLLPGVVSGDLFLTAALIEGHHQEPANPLTTTAVAVPAPLTTHTLSSSAPSRIEP